MPSTINPRVLVENVERVTVASFADVDLISDQVIEEVAEELNTLPEGAGLERVVLNFRGVRAMSSSMHAVLLKFSRRVAASNGRLRLCRIDPSLREIFKITRFDKIFEIHDEEASALDSF